MADWFTTSEDDAINLLKRDHDTVEALFKQFEKTEDPAQRKVVAREAMTLLKAHAVIEEEIFYPTVRRAVGDETMNEADEEHHVAKVLIAELEDMPESAPHFDAKFTVLAESIRHHVKEEEREMLPKARKAEIDFEALGRKMKARKQQVLTQGFPPAAEEKMVKASHGMGDSPAARAVGTPMPPPR
jgi:hemerythrin-like domain-containing protein